jgi:hypothetical protein
MKLTRKIAFEYLILSGFFSFLLFSCQKEKKHENVQSNGNNNQIVYRMSNLSDLDEVKNESYEIHNEYLEQLLQAYTLNQLPTINTHDNFIAQTNWSKEYFTDISMDMTMWSSIENIVLSKYNASNSSFEINCSVYNTQASTQMKHYTDIIISNIQLIMNNDEDIDLIAICDDIFSTMKNDTNLSSNEKLALASIIGVVQGSYTYWDIHSETWPNIIRPDIQAKWKQVAGFLLADAMGAMDGAAAGSVTLIGTVPGAVLGGALYSGFTAWSW